VGKDTKYLSKQQENDRIIPFRLPNTTIYVSPIIRLVTQKGMAQWGQAPLRPGILN